LNQKFSSKRFGQKFLWLQNHFLGNRFEPKIFINFHEKFLVQNFLWLQNHFLENGFDPKIFVQNFLVQKFSMVAKSFPGRRGLTENFHQSFSGRKIFYACNIISSETGFI